MDKQFKRICRNRYFYEAEICSLQEELKRIDILMSKPRSPRIEVIGQPAHDYQSHISEWMEEKRRIEEQIECLQKNVDMVDRIKALPKPWNNIYWENLVDGYPAREVCREYGISKDKFYRKLVDIYALLMEVKL